MSSAPMSDAAALLSLSVLLNGERVLQLPPLGASVDVATIKMLIEAETNISSGSLVLLHKQRVLTDAQTLSSVGVATNEMLEARTGGVMAGQARPANAATTAAAAGAQGQQRRPQQQQHPLGPSSNRLGIPDSILHDASRARDYLRATPGLLFQIESQNPALYRSVMGSDLAPFAAAWKQITDNMAAEKAAELERFRMATADPMDPTVQAKIEEEIRLKNVQENWESAMEYNPEVFGRVLMLYVPMSVNGVKLQAFVDSGAQSTIMSVQCAERTGIMRLIDKRYAGVAKGVGSAKILGRVHQVPCVIGTKHVAMSFTIDFLLGLDQLKNHQACIDLGKNVLRIQGEEIAFLAEKDLPRENKEGLGAGAQGDDDEWEDGSKATGSSSSASSSSAAASSAAAGSSARPAAAAAAASAAGSNASRPAAAAGSNVSVSPPASAPSAASAAAVAAAQNRAAAAAAHSAAHSAAAPPARPAQQQPPPAAAAVPVAAPRPPAAAAAHPGSAVAGAAPFPESVIEQLVGLGFSRAESIQALHMCGGNAELAAGHLFNM